MMDRKNGQDHDAGLKPHVQTGRILREIPVREHDTLALARRARGKHDRRQLVGLRRVVKSRMLPADQFPHGLLLRDPVRLAHAQDMLQLRTALCCHLRHARLRLVIDERRDIRAVDQLAQIRFRKIRIERHDNAPAVRRTKVRYHPRVGRRPHDRDMFPLLPQFRKHSRKTFRILFQLRVCFCLDPHFLFAIAAVFHLVAERVLCAKILLCRRQQLPYGTMHLTHIPLHTFPFSGTVKN